MSDLSVPAGAAAPLPANAVAPAVAAPGHRDSWWQVLRRRGSMTRWVVLGTSVALLVAWAGVLALLALRRSDALQAEREHSANLAGVLREQTVRVLAAVDQATLRLRDEVRNGTLDPAEIVRDANETGLAPKILTQLSLIGADGRFIGSNLDPDGAKSGHVDLSSREHVRVHLAPHLAPDAPPISPGGLFVGKPVLGKVSNKWTIQLSRRIDGADGKVLGVVVASLDPLYFEELYRAVALGAQGGVTLLGLDQNVRARVLGGRSVGMGTTLAASGAARLVGSEGLYEAPSRLDGIRRMFTYRQVADYPLYVVVYRSFDEALEAWAGMRNVMVGLMSLLTAAVLAAAVIFAVGVRRLEDTNEALRVSEQHAKAANQAKTEFLAAVSHELRTPLTSIRGFAELMEMRIKDERFREQAGLIRKAAEYLNALLTEILDLVKIEAGSMQVMQVPVDLRPVVDGAADFFGVTAAEKGLQLSTHIAPDLATQVLGDDLRVKQVLNNLLSNAFKFTEKGSVRIEVDRDGDFLRLHVVDTGPGIPKHLHEIIFERFRQADEQVSHQHGGTGLGLALARALAELMGGTLGVQSEVGQGSRFTLRLPMAQA